MGNILNFGVFVAPPNPFLRFTGSNDIEVVAPGFGAADYVVYDWRLNGSSISQLHVPMQSGGVDVSSYNRTLTFLGSPTANLDGGYGASKRFFEFDGDNDGFDYGTWNWNDGFGADNEQTILSYFAAAPGQTRSIIVGQSHASTHVAPYYKYFHRIAADNPATNNRGEARVGFYVTSTSIGSVDDDNAVHSMVSVFDSGTFSSYIDGVVDTSLSGTAESVIQDSSRNVRIGARHVPLTGLEEEWMDGSIGYVNLMDRAVSDEWRAMFNPVGSTSPDFSVLAAEETNVGEFWSCRIIGYNNSGVVLNDFLTDQLEVV